MTQPHVIVSDLLACPEGMLAKGPVYITVEDGSITSITKEDPQITREHFYSHTHLLTPGFIDIHTHGLGGSDDVLDFWLHPEHTQQLLPRKGTTSFLATMIFPRDRGERTTSILHHLSQVVGKTDQGAVLEGIHAEGPIVNDLGAMPLTDTEMSLESFQELLDSIPFLKVMTISPHLEAKVGYKRLNALLARGVRPALGHDRIATEDEILGALACSLKTKMHITHLFNVCSFHHRLPSLVNYGLTDKFPSLPKYKGLLPPTVELIADMAHIHPMVLSTTLKARHYKDIAFITDSVFEPKPGAMVDYVGRKLQVASDCRSLHIVGGDVLAGSCCSMLDSFHNLVNVLEVPLGEAVSMLTENPARIAGLRHIGAVEVGKRADLLMFDSNLQLQETLIAGQTMYKNAD